MEDPVSWSLILYSITVISRETVLGGQCSSTASNGRRQQTDVTAVSHDLCLEEKRHSRMITTTINSHRVKAYGNLAAARIASLRSRDTTATSVC